MTTNPITNVTLPEVDTTAEVCGTSQRENVLVYERHVVDMNVDRPDPYVTLVIGGTHYVILRDASGWPHLIAEAGFAFAEGAHQRTRLTFREVEVGQKVMIEDHRHVYTLIDEPGYPAFARC